MRSSAKVCLFGASPSTGNQGVNALCWSALEGILERTPADVHVFGYGEANPAGVVPGSEPPLLYKSESMSAGRRIWRSGLPDSPTTSWLRNLIEPEVGS